MRTNRLAATSLLAGLLLGSISMWVGASRGEAPAARTAIVWEYKSIQMGQGPSELNVYGKDGWELVVALENKVGVVYIFKRTKP